MSETWTMRLGEERPVKLPVLAPPAGWRADVSGMQSAVRVQRMWASDPYPDDDQDEDGSSSEQPSMVFMIRGAAPGEAVVRFVASGGSSADPREIRISVTR